MIRMEIDSYSKQYKPKLYMTYIYYQISVVLYAS